MAYLDATPVTEEASITNYTCLLNAFAADGLIGYFNFQEMVKIASFGVDEMYVDEYDGYLKPFIASDRMQVVNMYLETTQISDTHSVLRPYTSEENNVYIDDENWTSSSLIFSLFQFDEKCETVRLSAGLLSFIAFDTLALADVSSNDEQTRHLFTLAPSQSGMVIPMGALRMARSLFLQHFAGAVSKAEVTMASYDVEVTPENLSQYVDFACLVHGSELNGYTLIQEIQKKLAVDITEELYCIFVKNGWSPQFVFALYLSRTEISSIEMLEALFSIYNSAPYAWFHAHISEQV
jgi:hypothetical protein